MSCPHLSSKQECYIPFLCSVTTFTCIGTPSADYVSVNPTACPIGYVFCSPGNILKPQGTCECINICNGDIQCDLLFGVASI